MYMSDSLDDEPARPLGSELNRDAILMIAECDLLSECLADVLSRRFPELELSVQRSTSAFVGEDGLRLVLLYRLQPAAIPGLIRAIRHYNPDSSIAIVADGPQIFDDRFFRDLVDAREIEGILPLNLRLDVFLAAVDLLAKGGEHFPSALLQRLRRDSMTGNGGYETMAYGRPGRMADAPLRLNGDGMGLTTREVQILNMLCEGTQNKIIADRLNLSENTVKVHIRNLYKKMQVRNRTEAVSRFFNTDRSSLRRSH